MAKHITNMGRGIFRYQRGHESTVYFSITKYGSEEAAIKAAEAYRAEQYKKFPEDPAIKSKLGKTYETCNMFGTGVTRRVNTKTGSSSYIAQWTEGPPEKRYQRSRSFNVADYGEMGALKKAQLHRKRAIKEKWNQVY